MRAPLDDPIMADFVMQADEIDDLAQRTPGFVAQLTPNDEGTEFLGNELLNLSIWESIESILEYTYHGKHALALERRAKWFEQHDWPNYVLYWVSAGHLPTEEEVKQRLDYLAHHGPTSFAFTFEHPFSVQEMLASDFESS